MSPRPHVFGTLFTLLLLTLALGAAPGCRGVSTTPIKTLLDDPGQYDGKTVAIEGDVTRSYGVLGYGAYQVNDGTGTLSVITKEGGAPRTGAHVGVIGTFRSAFTLGTETAAVLKEDRRTNR
jgi:hypothetical protein